MEKLQLVIQNHFNKNMKGKPLFRVNLSGTEIWETYLNSFTVENNPKFRDPSSSEKNCNYCNNFFRRYGNIIALDDDFNIISLFDVVCSEEYQVSMNALSNKIRNSIIVAPFLETWQMLNSLPYESGVKKTANEFKLGIQVNHKQYNKAEAELYGVVKEGEIKSFHHMCLTIPAMYVDTTGKSVESLISVKEANKDVFQRAMEEISLDVYSLVIDLINQKSLLDATAQLTKLQVMKAFKKAYDDVSNNNKNSWCWLMSDTFGFPKFRNELIGVLCTELTQGEDLNQAVLNWNKRVDPANYMKAVAPITKAQVALAKKFIQENGYETAFTRRYATIEDIRVTEILHLNEEGEQKKASIFDDIPTKKTSRSRSNFDDVQDVPIKDFLKNILPTATSVEAYLENRYTGNMMTLTTAKEDVKNIHSYNNPYSMTFNGNLAGKSEIKTQIEKEGGITDGVLNFRLAWNKKGGTDNSDLDAWAREPDKTRIGFSTNARKKRSPGRTSMSGQLDVDNTNPDGNLAVENITWNNLSAMKDGIYTLWVNQYSSRNSQGFQAEIEYNNETFHYIYDQPVKGNVVVAEVTLENGQFSIDHKLPHTNFSKEIYGLNSKEFHKVNLICNSPNHWDEPTGNLYYLFLLEDAANPNAIRSFHNVDLVPELKAQRKVLDVLGNQCMLEPTTAKKQLSGLGFNSTVKDNLIVKVKGSHNRIINITF